MDKKAQSGLMVSLIAFLAAAIILVIIYSVIIPEVQDTADSTLCKMTVGAKYMVGVASLKTVEANVNLLCYTQTIEVKEDGIYKSGKKRKPTQIKDFAVDKETAGTGLAGAAITGAFITQQPPSAPVDTPPETPTVPDVASLDEVANNIEDFESNFYSDDELNRVDLVRRVIANEAYDCWDQFYEGTAPIFYGRKKRCVICSEIKFEDGWLDDKSFDSFFVGQFFNERMIPGQKKTYAQFFGGRWEDNFLIEPNEKTLIVFKGVGRSWVDNYLAYGSLILGCAVGITAGVITVAGVTTAAVAATSASLGVAAPLAVGAIAVSVVKGVGMAVAGCTVGGAIAGGEAFRSGEDWVPMIVIGSESTVLGESCDRLY